MCAWKSIPSNGLGVEVEVEVEGVGVVMGIVTSAAIKQKSHDSHMTVHTYNTYMHTYIHTYVRTYMSSMASLLVFHFSAVGQAT